MKHTDAERRAEAEALYNALVVCQSRAQAIGVIRRGLLLARIAGSNAAIIHMGRRPVRPQTRTRRGRDKSRSS